ncbi:MAG: carotenoid oxygenase family protein [Acidimicrobiales bacterium]|nr:carotenoid oxygenase family protein [Acidimicrobiales bacterium]
MKVQIHDTLPHTLPPDDSHPYRSGAWRPQHVEYDAWDLDVEGEIPADLSGVYLRNTENPLHPPIERYHPFDGDGMVHSISFENGEARYANRFVRTDGLLEELDAQESLWAGLAELPASAKAPHRIGARPQMKDAASTDIVVHRGQALASFYMCGDLYRLDPRTLAADGKEDWNGQFPAHGVSAHPKVDEHTGELLFFNYGTEWPYMHYGEVSADGELTTYQDVELPGARLPHDMAFTENYAIVNDCPMFWDPAAIDAGLYVPRLFPDLPTRFGVIPRGGGDVQWFEADPTYVLHWMNAYEAPTATGTEIVLDGFFQKNPSPRRRPEATFEENLYRYLDLHSMLSVPYRWRFDLETGETTEGPLHDEILEFGMINGRYGGRPYRYSYDALPAAGWFGFHGVVKHDVETGDLTTYRLPEGVYASETVMAPRDGSTAEDDGYLVTFTIDLANDRSQCVVLDAADPAAGPVATISLPERMSSGTHAFWAPASSL